MAPSRLTDFETNQKYTITMDCQGCGKSFIGVSEHLVDAIKALTVSVGMEDGHHLILGQELRLIGEQAIAVEAEVTILDIIDKIVGGD